MKKDKLDKYKEKLDHLLYDITVYSLTERGLSYDEIEQNYNKSIHYIFNMCKATLLPDLFSSNMQED